MDVICYSELESRMDALRVYECKRYAVKVILENMDIQSSGKLQIQMSDICKEPHEQLMATGRHHPAWCYPRSTLETTLDRVVQSFCSTGLAQQWINRSLVQLSQSRPVITVSLCLVRPPLKSSAKVECFLEAFVM